MIAYFLKLFGIYIACLFKFFAGPLLGVAAGLNFFEILLVSVGGMMTSVFFMSYLGDWIKRRWSLIVLKKKKTFSAKTRRIVRIWQKFGPIGVAAFTPLFLTPIGGTIIMTAFNVEKKKVFAYMFISAMAWGVFFALSMEWIKTLPYLRDLFG